MDSTLDIGRCRGAHLRPPSALSTIRLGHAAVSEVRHPFRPRPALSPRPAELSPPHLPPPSDYWLAPIGHQSKYVSTLHYSIALHQFFLVDAREKSEYDTETGVQTKFNFFRRGSQATMRRTKRHSHGNTQLMYNLGHD